MSKENKREICFDSKTILLYYNIFYDNEIIIHRLEKGRAKAKGNENM